MILKRGSYIILAVFQPLLRYEEVVVTALLII